MSKTRWGILGFVVLGACAPLSRQEPPGKPYEPKVAAHVPEAATTPASSQSTVAKQSPVVKPEAVFFIPPANTPLPPEVTQSLRAVLDKQQGRKNVLFTLEVAPSAEGNREINLELARQAANRLRNKLVELGVRPYRVKIAVRGEAHVPGEVPSTPEKQRVDLFLSILAR